MPKERASEEGPVVHCQVIVGFLGSLEAPRRGGYHTHPYWQLEIMLEGRAVARVAPEAIALEPGDCLLIPPDLRHGFRKSDPPLRWATFRFTATGVRPQEQAHKLRMTPLNASLRDALLHATPRSLAAPDTRNGRVVGALLAALLEHNQPEAPLAAPGMRESGLARDVRAYVRRHANLRVPVDELAHLCGYSPHYFPKKFRRETGQGLKEFVDRERCRMAENLLAHSDLSVGHIARDVGFGDIYSFSRFFKRVTGRSPRAYRVGLA